MPLTPFRELEINLLRISGLSDKLAEKHIDHAIEAFNANPTASLERIAEPMLILGDIERLQEVSCQSADLLAQGLRHSQSRRRWAQILTFGLGGTLIVVANGVATTILGPVGLAASGAIGSAAIGTGLNLLSLTPSAALSSGGHHPSFGNSGFGQELPH